MKDWYFLDYETMYFTWQSHSTTASYELNGLLEIRNKDKYIDVGFKLHVI